MLEDLILRRARRSHVARHINSGRNRQSVIDHKFDSPVGPKRRVTPVEHGIKRVDVTAVEYIRLVARRDENHARPDTLLQYDRNEPRIVGRQKPLFIIVGVGDACFRSQDSRVEIIVSTTRTPSARNTLPTAASTLSSVV